MIPDHVRDKVNHRNLVEDGHGGLHLICQSCGHDGSIWRLDMHHIKFKSRGGEDTAENLKLLCSRCHGSIHGRLV